LDDCQVALLRLAACWSVYLHAREIQKDVNFGTSATAPQGLPMLDTRIRWMCPELDKSGALSMTMP
jgi:hypothetical protein